MHLILCYNRGTRSSSTRWRSSRRRQQRSEQFSQNKFPVQLFICVFSYLSICQFVRVTAQRRLHCCCLIWWINIIDWKHGLLNWTNDLIYLTAGDMFFVASLGSSEMIIWAMAVWLVYLCCVQGAECCLKLVLVHTGLQFVWSWFTYI